VENKDQTRLVRASAGKHENEHHHDHGTITNFQNSHEKEVQQERKR
jgi:hypothetical protein